MAPRTTKKTEAEPDWAMPPVNDRGQQVASDGLPLVGLARSMALAEAGTKSDPLEIVSDEEIAAHDFKGLQADLDALAAAEEAETGLQPGLAPILPSAPPAGDASTTGE